MGSFFWGLLLFALLGLNAYAASKAGLFALRHQLERLLLGYLLLVLISPLALYLLPRERLAHTVDASMVFAAQAAGRDLLPAALAGHPASVAGARRANEWRFAVTDGELSIAGIAPHLPVIVERTASGDGKIYVAAYATPSIFWGMDISAWSPPPITISFVAGTLTITQHPSQDIELIKFMPEASAEQIPAAVRPQADFVSTSILGTQLVYIRLPRDVVIRDPHPDLMFVHSGAR